MRMMVAVVVLMCVDWIGAVTTITVAEPDALLRVAETSTHRRCVGDASGSSVAFLPRAHPCQ